MLKTKFKKFTNASKNKAVAALFFLSLASVAPAQANSFYNGHTGAVSSVDELFKDLGPGTVLITSELHDHEVHHQNQRDILARLATLKIPISVGMEFFYYPQQSQVDDFVSGRIDEATFLKAINWAGFNFDFYRYQVLQPAHLQGQTVALNFPRELSGKVAKGGLDALSADEKAMMPPNFERGTDTYFARFREMMKDHATEEQMQNYFTAQSLWDDTMAWKATGHIIAHPDGLLMIIVGDFHVAYQDGLIARLKKRGATHIVSLSQIDTTGSSEADRKAQIAPDATYGARADYIFDVN
jgi:uncharacterized iron-regulated protein